MVPPCSHLRRLQSGLCLALALTGSLGAAELVVADLRLGLDLRPTDFDYTITHPIFGETSGSDSFETGLGFSLRGLHAFDSPGSAGAFVVGGEGTFAYHEYGSESSVYMTYGLRAMGGYRYAFTERLAFDALAFAGFGIASYELSDPGVFDTIETDGYVTELGALVGAHYNLSPNWILEAEAGWLTTEADLEGAGLDVLVEEAGFTFFLGVSYRFGGSRPPVLE